ncbi:protein FAR1-RELATED SEQUENCE 5-like [Actinidia eriantha]|uniref:protein FAR1-RELATED SEQUENCE 5-like n=1 Tax=Actinidia eriantha TaxID=165200 RepID=UPI0025880813|nr:protein FAR1-RELATED SEQUENCE 5-like [Actinidia eriantha]
MVLDDVQHEDSLNLEYSHCVVGGVVEPTLDMEFASEDDARNFYNAYAKQKGFSIHVNSYYRSKKDNSIISPEFCCSKEGFRTEKRGKGMELEEDCKRRRARPITREDYGKWCVSKLEKNHNHELVTPGMRQFLRSHKQEYDPKKSSTNSFSPISTSSSTNVLSKDCDSFGDIVFAPQNHVNYIGNGRLSTFGIDAQSLLGFFKIMQVSDPVFYYAIQVDEENWLSSVFWVDTRSRIVYECFSDALAFDTTYQVNQYKMPFAPFAEVRHHRHSVLFGSALLADETKSTFIWLFTTWLEAMSGRQPGLIITDYDSSICKAVERVFPESGHRYCKWHITSKVTKEMGHAYSALLKTFPVELINALIRLRWQKNLNLCGSRLSISTSLEEMNGFRTYATQRSGSVNSLFDGYVNAGTTLQDFAEQYEKALDDRYEKEVKAEFETFYTKPIL